MDGIHDLGGKHGFGLVDDPSGVVAGSQVGFEQRWHAVVFTMVNGLLATGTAPNVDYFRHAVERIDPVNYLDDGYYGRWLGAAETILVEAGVLSQQEVTARALTLGADSAQRIAARPGVRGDFPKAGAQSSALRADESEPQFKLGDVVGTSPAAVSGHTRLPAYARGAEGVVVAHHNTWTYPDTNAHGQGEQPQHLYTVEFASAALWGAGGEADVQVCLDLFEPYLELIGGAA